MINMFKVKIEVGDTVHARFYSFDRSNVVTQNFTVTKIDGDVYYGGAIDCDTSQGWEVELTAKNPVNLCLPSTLSEITALLFDKSIVHLSGKHESWVTDSGEIVPVSSIFAWGLGHYDL